MEKRPRDQARGTRSSAPLSSILHLEISLRRAPASCAARPAGPRVRASRRMATTVHRPRARLVSHGPARCYPPGVQSGDETRPNSWSGEGGARRPNPALAAPRQPRSRGPPGPGLEHSCFLRGRGWDEQGHRDRRDGSEAASVTAPGQGN